MPTFRLRHRQKWLIAIFFVQTYLFCFLPQTLMLLAKPLPPDQNNFLSKLLITNTFYNIGLTFDLHLNHNLNYFSFPLSADFSLI